MNELFGGAYRDPGMKESNHIAELTRSLFQSGEAVSFIVSMCLTIATVEFDHIFSVPWTFRLTGTPE